MKMEMDYDAIRVACEITAADAVAARLHVELEQLCRADDATCEKLDRLHDNGAAFADIERAWNARRDIERRIDTVRTSLREALDHLAELQRIAG